MVETSAAYKELLLKLQEISHLENAVSALSYDRMVFMPESAAAARGSQMSILAKIIHEKATDPQLEKLLEQANRDLNTDDDEQKEKDDARILLRLAREEYDKKTRIPPALEAKRAELSSTAYAAWVKAKQQNDFQLFASYLKECFDVAQQTAKYLRGNVDENKDDRSLYTVLLNEYERGMPVQRIDEIFDMIEKVLVLLLQKVLKASSTSQIDPTPLTSVAGFSLDVDRQKTLTQKIVTALGYDASRGRIDVSVHPFTSSVGGRHDVRITSRYNDREWYSGLAGAIHECGHAMYEQNLGNSNTVLDQYLSMGCHESQSLFWERHVGMSYPFACYLLPIVSDILGIKENAAAATTPLTAMDIYRAVNQVQPGLIRVDADELTYPLHVLLRYRIERELLSEDDDTSSSSLTVDQVPNRWNQAMKEMLGVDVPSDAQGCLQDVHWASLAIGYFPTYLIGSSVRIPVFKTRGMYVLSLYSPFCTHFLLLEFHPFV
jgi:carboxypeptidase Taq